MTYQRNSSVEAVDNSGLKSIHQLFLLKRICFITIYFNFKIFQSFLKYNIN